MLFRSLIARHFAATHGDKLNSLVLHASIYKRSVEQNRVVQNRFELIKRSRPASQDRALRRWFSDTFIKNNKETYNKVLSILKENELANLLKVYKLFVNYKDDDQMFNDIKVNTLVTTGQHDVGSTPEMSKNLTERIKSYRKEADRKSVV